MTDNQSALTRPSRVPSTPAASWTSSSVATCRDHPDHRTGAVRQAQQAHLRPRYVLAPSARHVPVGELARSPVRSRGPRWPSRPLVLHEWSPELLYVAVHHVAGWPGLSYLQAFGGLALLLTSVHLHTPVLAAPHSVPDRNRSVARRLGFGRTSPSGRQLHPARRLHHCLAQDVRRRPSALVADPPHVGLGLLARDVVLRRRCRRRRRTRHVRGPEVVPSFSVADGGNSACLGSLAAALTPVGPRLLASPGSIRELHPVRRRVADTFAVPVAVPDHVGDGGCPRRDLDRRRGARPFWTDLFAPRRRRGVHSGVCADHRSRRHHHRGPGRPRPRQCRADTGQTRQLEKPKEVAVLGVGLALVCARRSMDRSGRRVQTSGGALRIRLVRSPRPSCRYRGLQRLPTGRVDALGSIPELDPVIDGRCRRL